MKLGVSYPILSLPRQVRYCHERAVVGLERASRLCDMSEREPDDETANQLLELAISSAELAGEYIGLHDKIIKAMRPEVEG